MTPKFSKTVAEQNLAKANAALAAPTGSPKSQRNVVKTKYQIYYYSFSSDRWLPIDGFPTNFKKCDLNSWEDVESYLKSAVRGHYKVERIYITEPMEGVRVCHY